VEDDDDAREIIGELIGALGHDVVPAASAGQAVLETERQPPDVAFIDLGLPGVVEDDVELTVERNVVTIRARRAPARQDGDEVIIDERPYGQFTRQLFLGDNLDAGRMTADLRDGVLRLTIPVSEESKPRRIPLGSSGDQQPAEVSTSTG